MHDARELGTRTIIFSGGEPFEHPNLVELCGTAKDHGLHVQIYTSGNVSHDSAIVPISEETISDLRHLYIDKMVFGLHRATARVHDSMTKIRGSYRNAIISIRRCWEKLIPVEINTVPTKINFETLPELLALAERLHVERISVLRFVAQGRGELNSDMLTLEPHESRKLRSILTRMLSSNEPSVRVGAPFNVFCIFGGNYCTAGKTRATIRADGYVFPCEALKQQQQYSDNNLRAGSLKQIWERSAIFREARHFADLISKSRCRYCSMFSKCKGGCPAQRLISDCSIDPLCPMIKAIAYNV